MNRIIHTVVFGILLFANTAIANNHNQVLTATIANFSDSFLGQLNPQSGLQHVNQVGLRRCENAGIPRPPDFDCHHSLWQEIASAPSQYGPPRTSSTARRFIYLGQNPAGFCVLTADFASSWGGSGGSHGPVSITCTGATGNSCDWSRNTGSWSNTALHPIYQFNLVVSSTGNGGFCAQPASASALPVELRRDNFSVATVTPP